MYRNHVSCQGFSVNDRFINPARPLFYSHFRLCLTSEKLLKRQRFKNYLAPILISVHNNYLPSVISQFSPTRRIFIFFFIAFQCHGLRCIYYPLVTVRAGTAAGLPEKFRLIYIFLAALRSKYEYFQSLAASFSVCLSF